MATALDVVVEFLKSQNWRYDLDEKNGRVFTGVDGDNGQWRFSVAVSEEQKLCLVLSRFPQKCPQSRRRACTELLTRINHGLISGSFEMDMDDGTINFKTTYPFPEGQMDTETLEIVLGSHILAMDRYFPALMSVIYARVPPKVAVARAEQTPKNPDKSYKQPGPGRFLNN